MPDLRADIPYLSGYPDRGVGGVGGWALRGFSAGIVKYLKKDLN